MLNVPIFLTDAAKEKLIELTGEVEGAIGVKLSIAQGRGCGGNEYRMERIREEQPDLDKIILDNDIALYIPVTDSFMMFGMIIDHSLDAVGNEQFVFQNPNEGHRCGCGSSFSIDPEKLRQQKQKESA
jgi:iron-sulfur cluster assembly protein